MANTDAYNPPMTLGDKLWSQTALEGGRSALIKKTYLLLALSVASGLAGGFIGAHSPAIVHLFSGWLGWVLAMVALNVIPPIALAARHDPVLGVAALAGDGFVSGLVLAPILHLASVVAPDVVPAALLLTAIGFAAVTGYVLTTDQVFSAPRGLMTGIFFSIVGVIVLNGLLNVGILSIVIAGAIGTFGVFVLIHATSEVLHNPELDSPLPGALLLFAGLFNIFVAALNILLRVASSEE